MLQSNPGTIEVYFDGLVLSWAWTLEPRNRQLQRLEFEAALIESVEPQHHTFSRALYDNWQRIGQNALVSLGLTEADAALETRLIINTFYGIQYDFVLNNDAEAATAAFELAMARHRARLEELVEASIV
jgi:hypothetical protein